MTINLDLILRSVRRLRELAIAEIVQCGELPMLSHSWESERTGQPEHWVEYSSGQSPELQIMVVASPRNHHNLHEVVVAR